MEKAKSKLQRDILLGIHLQLVASSDYQVARRFLRFLIRRRIRLGLDDEDWQLESILQSVGLQPGFTNWRTGSADYYLN